MRRSPKTLRSKQTDDSQQLAKWTREYAQNRSLGVVVFMVIFGLLASSIGGVSYLAGEAYRGGNMLVFGVCLILLGFALAANFYLAVPRWGGKLMNRVTERLYAREGQVTVSTPAGTKKRWGIVLAICFGICVLASVLLGDRIAVQYRQPVMALYLVPFLIVLNLLQRPTTSFLALLWPFLFGLHAVLILVGVPIVFSGRWQSLNILIPVVGYGLLSAVVSHLYSRFALSRLKQLAQGNKHPRSPENRQIFDG